MRVYVQNLHVIDRAAGAGAVGGGGTARFLCDTMMEGLARQLRMFGVDAASVSGDGSPKRHITYR